MQDGIKCAGWKIGQNRAVLGIYDSPPITQGRKHDITYNGAAGRLRGSWVTIAMMESYPLELAEVRVYGSK